MKKAFAFTVIELLVVVAILAILVALIYPVTQKVRTARENSGKVHVVR